MISDFMIMIIGVWLIFLLFFIIFPCVAVAQALRKKILVFYDASDALLSVLVYGMIAALEIFFVTLAIKFNVRSVSDLLGYSVPLSFISSILSLAILIYSAYAAYLYNRPKTFAVLLSFTGRFIIGSFIMILPLFILLSTMLYRFSGKIFLSPVLVGIIFYIVCIRLLIYKFTFSDISFYVNFSKMASLGKEFHENIKQNSGKSHKKFPSTEKSPTVIINNEDENKK